MGLPRWKGTGGRDFVFYHSHPGFEWDDLDITNAYQETVCNDFQVRLSQPLERNFDAKHVTVSLRLQETGIGIAPFSDQRVMTMAGGRKFYCCESGQILQIETTQSAACRGRSLSGRAQNINSVSSAWSEGTQYQQGCQCAAETVMAVA